jgi:UDP-2-acetamido-2,6-beta-L-arabino-hexul-4-ose reductase
VKILITGSKGFIGKNLYLYLKENSYSVSEFNKSKTIRELKEKVSKSDIIINLVGQNRGEKSQFKKNNVSFINKIIEKKFLKKKFIIHASTIKINENSIYGKSKKESEILLKKNRKVKNYDLTILRLPNIFGKWCKPNYNSVISTFCYNIIYNKNIKINYSKKIPFLYIDDLIILIEKIILNKKRVLLPKIKNIYQKDLEYISKKLFEFKKKNNVFNLDNFQNSFDRKLYSTFVSYYPKNLFTQKLKCNVDHRGNFSELLKSNIKGQVSFFTIKKGKSRGEHYHNSKIERFFPVAGKGLIFFKSVLNNSKFKISFNAKNLKMIETIPGYSHKIYNTGSKDCIFICWANEVFDPNKPDTYYYKI